MALMKIMDKYHIIIIIFSRIPEWGRRGKHLGYWWESQKKETAR
jgi:hypothetical protein